MYIFFHERRLLGNKKGQFIPIFVVVLAVILIMTFVTANISKVALIRTDTSNAVDAGGLAGGSGMAGVFNNVAISNSYLQTSYWESFASISAQIALATGIAVAALAESSIALAAAAAGAAGGVVAETNAVGAAIPCAGQGPSAIAQGASDEASFSLTDATMAIGSAIKEMMWFKRIMLGVITSVTAFYIAQKFFFLAIKENAILGRKEAIKLGYRYAFQNSGISSKLKQDESITDAIRNVLQGQLGWGSALNFTNLTDLQNFDFSTVDFSLFGTFNSPRVYSLFVSSLQPFIVNMYPWSDAQGRGHLVAVMFVTQKVDTYDLQVTNMPFAAEMGLLSGIEALAIFAGVKLSAAYAAYLAAVSWYAIGASGYGVAVGLHEACCVPPGATCGLAIDAAIQAAGDVTAGIGFNATGSLANGFALGSIVGLLPLLVAAEVGLLPGRTARSPASGDIIAWIKDIVHNRMVYISSLQHHAGADLEMWRTRYPNMFSLALINFQGSGQIYPPKPRFDPSIIAVDFIPGQIIPPGAGQEGSCSMVQGQVQTIQREIATLQAEIDGLNNITIPDLQGQIDDFGSSPGDTDVSNLEGRRDHYREVIGLMQTEIGRLGGSILTIQGDNPDCF